jgi:hypothetical protein
MHNLDTTAHLFWDLNFQFRGGHGPAAIHIPIIWGCQLKYEKHEKFLMSQRLISACILEFFSFPNPTKYITLGMTKTP